MAGRCRANPLARLPGRRTLTRPAAIDAPADGFAPEGILRGTTAEGRAVGIVQRGAPMETAEALRETSDALLRDLDVLVALEEDKRTLSPGDPRLVELAEQIDQIAARVLGSAGRQRELTKLVNAQVDAGAPDAPEQSIAATVRPIAAILEEWRAAERRAVAAEPGSAEADEAMALVQLLRQEYRAAQDAARRER